MLCAIVEDEGVIIPDDQDVEVQVGKLTRCSSHDGTGEERTAAAGEREAFAVLCKSGLR